MPLACGSSKFLGTTEAVIAGQRHLVLLKIQEVN